MVKIELFKDDVVRTSDPTVIPGGGSPDNPTTDPNE